MTTRVLNKVGAGSDGALGGLCDWDGIQDTMCDAAELAFCVRGGFWDRDDLCLI